MYWFFLGNSEKKILILSKREIFIQFFKYCTKKLKSLHVINWLRRKKRESLIYIYSNAKH